MVNDSLSPQILREFLLYDSATGNLYWRDRPLKCFKSSRGQNTWNARYSGKQAFTAIKSSGYKCGSIFGHQCFAHRVIWAMETGEWPVEQIDHINHDKEDNRIINLREVTHQENLKNQTRQKRNGSGVCGVMWLKNRRKWKAQIKVNGKVKYLGSFTHKSDAIAARESANVKYNFHENHGAPQ